LHLCIHFPYTFSALFFSSYPFDPSIGPRPDAFFKHPRLPCLFLQRPLPPSFSVFPSPIQSNPGFLCCPIFNSALLSDSQRWRVLTLLIPVPSAPLTVSDLLPNHLLLSFFPTILYRATTYRNVILSYMPPPSSSQSRSQSLILFYFVFVDLGDLTLREGGIVRIMSFISFLSS